MSFCQFEKNAGVYGVTPIENIFLLEYLPTAPDGFLRVYLYARMLCLHPGMGGDLEKVARELGMEPDAVFNAMSYWERLGLTRRISDDPPAWELLPVQPGLLERQQESEFYENRDFNARLQALFGADNLLHPKQYAMASDWVETLGFTREAVLYMVEERVRRSRSKKPDAARLFQKLDRDAEAWSRRGVSTKEDVERAMQLDGRVEKAAGKVMKQLSMSRAPTVDELRMVDKWLNEWQLTEAQILEACEETTKSRRPTMAYLDSILKARGSAEENHFEALKSIYRELGVMGSPTPNQNKAYQRLLEEGFEAETILFAAQQCARKNKHRFEDLEWILERWGHDGIRRFDAAVAYVNEKNRAMEETRRLLEKCGLERRPHLDDIAYYEKFRASSPGELIDYAAELARGRQMPLKYMDKLLSDWNARGLTAVQEAKAAHESHVAAAGQRAGSAPANPALDYQQRNYTEEDYAGVLLDLSGDDEDTDGGADT